MPECDVEEGSIVDGIALLIDRHFWRVELRTVSLQMKWV